MPGDDRHDDVSVGRHAVLIDRDQPVGIAVEGQTDPAIDPGGKEIGVGGAASEVDVESVGLGGEQLHLGTEPLEQPRRCSVRRPVGAVEHHRQTGKEDPGLSGEMLHVDVDGVSQVGSHPNTLTGETARLPAGSEQPLDLLLLGVAQLGSVGPEQLDPVVLGRVVRRRDHCTHGSTGGGGEMGDPARGEHVDVHRVDAGGVQPGL